MATIRLVPSTYYLNSSTYLSVSNAANMYEVTDSSDTDYATVTNSQSGTTTYYIYIRGFNFSDVPSNAVVSGFTVKLRARESGISTSSSYAPKLCHGTSQITSTCSAITTTATTFTFTGVDADWEDIVGYGSDFGIRINCRRASRNTTGYMYIYGAEIEVTYTVPSPRTITTTLTGNGTIDPAGQTTTYDGEEFELIIVPANTTDSVSATKDGVDITSSLVHHAAGQDTESQVPATDFTTGFSDSGVNFYQNSSTTGTDWLEYAIGHSAESPYSTSNTSNTYAKPSGETAWINYKFDFDIIPSNATINSVSVKVYGAREESTINTTHVARFQCYSGSTPKGTLQNFTSTSNSLVTVTDVGTWTAAELHDAQLRFEVGYYGGRMLGITWTVVYTASDHYTYTYTVNGNSTIAVVIGSQATNTLYIKENGTWVECVVYKKVNGSWVQQSDPSSVLNTSMNLYKVTT